MVKIKLLSILESDWLENAKQKAKLRTYILLKSNYGAESFVKLNLSRRQRSLTAQIRAGVLPLRIETGRFRHESLDRRLCEFCQSNSIESEIHFLLHCPFYDDLRTSYMKCLTEVQVSNIADTEILKLIFEQNNVINTAKYVEKAFL